MCIIINNISTTNCIITFNNITPAEATCITLPYDNVLAKGHCLIKHRTMGVTSKMACLAVGLIPTMEGINVIVICIIT
jgi:hypothetical protein